MKKLHWLRFNNGFKCSPDSLMSKFLIGVVTGIILSTVGFNGLANLGNRVISGVESFATENQ